MAVKKEKDKTLKLMFKPKGELKAGRIAMFYGESGVGKTISSCYSKDKDKKIIFVPNGYDPSDVLENMGMDLTNFFVADKESTGITDFFKWREVFMNPATYEGVDRVIFDDISVMLTELLNEVADADKGSIKEDLAKEVKLDPNDYQVVNLLLMRLMMMLRNIVETTGLEVIFTAHLDDQIGMMSEGKGYERKMVKNPDAEYDKAPMFASAKVTQKVKALLDILGFVRPKRKREIVPVDEEGNELKPKYTGLDVFVPQVEMMPKSRNMSKWRGCPKYGTAPHHFYIEDIMNRSKEKWETK